MAVYKLMPEERIVAMMGFKGAIIVATSYRLFEMNSAGKDFVIKPILMEDADGESED